MPYSTTNSNIASITNHDPLVLYCIQNKGGRLKGSTDLNKRVTSDAIVATKNKTTLNYPKVKENAGGEKVPNKLQKQLLEMLNGNEIFLRVW